MSKIDFQRFLKNKTLGLSLKENIKETGFFLFENCFDSDFVDNVHQSIIALFSQSDDIKKQCYVDKKQSPLGHGFSPFGISKDINTGIPNLLETWDISPTKKNWPTRLTAEWEILINYQRQLRKISLVGCSVIELVLEIKEGELVKLVDTDRDGGIHLIHYFPITKKHNCEARRQGKHCDNTLLTLVPPPYPVESGLSTFNRTKNIWEDLIIDRRSCFVQTGLILQQITNQYLLANIHTVNNPELNSPLNVSRYSTPFFLGPKRTGNVYKIPKFITNEDGNGKINPLAQIEFDYFKKIF